MSDAKNSKAGNIAGIVVLVIAAYVLSLGPVIRQAGPHPPRAAELVLMIFYAPLEFLSKHNNVCNEALDAYLKLWGAYD